MPIYDYACKVCGTTLELTRTISERDSTESDICPQCGTKSSLERLLSSPMIAYSVTTPGGYGRVPDGFKDVLKKCHSAPGALQTSSFL